MAAPTPTVAAASDGVHVSHVCAEDVFTQADWLGQDTCALTGKVMPSALQLIDVTEYGRVFFTIAGNPVYDQGQLVDATDTSSLVYAACTMREWQMAHCQAALAASGAAKTNFKLPITWSKDFVFDSRADRVGHTISMVEIVRAWSQFELVSAEAHERYQSLSDNIAAAKRDRRALEEQQREVVLGSLASGSQPTTRSASEQKARLSMIADKDNEIMELSAEQAQVVVRQGKATPLTLAPVLSVEGVKRSLLYNGPVVVTLPLFDRDAKSGCFWSSPAASLNAGIMDTKRQQQRAMSVQQQYKRPSSVAPLVHSVAIIGFTDEHACFLIRNSWGPTWNANGHAWMPYSVIETKQFKELWTLFPQDEHVRPVLAALTRPANSKTELQSQWTSRLAQHQRFIPRSVPISALSTTSERKVDHPVSSAQASASVAPPISIKNRRRTTSSQPPFQAASTLPTKRAMMQQAQPPAARTPLIVQLLSAVLAPNKS
jgi:hypothetical protein